MQTYGENLFMICWKKYGYKFSRTWHIKKDNVSEAAIVAGNRAHIALWLECIPVFFFFNPKYQSSR